MSKIIKLVLLHLLVSLFALPAYANELSKENLSSFSANKNLYDRFILSGHPEAKNVADISRYGFNTCFPQPLSLPEVLSTKSPSDVFLSEIRNENNAGDDNQVNSPPRLRIIPPGEGIQGVPLQNDTVVLLFFSIVYTIFLYCKNKT